MSTTESAIVLVGGKPPLNYVTACLTLFNRGEKEVLLRARGKSISNCVTAVELLRRSFVRNLKVKNIALGSDERTMPNGKKQFVSYMEITLEK